MRTFTSLIFVFAIAVVLACTTFASYYPAELISPQKNKPMDTIEWLTPRTHLIKVVKGKKQYWVNGQKVSKEEYDRWDFTPEEFNTCRPCYIKKFNSLGKPEWEGGCYTDCFIGEHRTFYPNGKVAVSSNYWTDSTGVFDSLTVSKMCGTSAGTWTYYDPSGQIDSVVNYRNGKRVNQ